MKLEINKLMSSREFGELIRSEEPGFKNREDYLIFYESLRNGFDDFLKQHLAIWMFVPCKLVDGVWVVFEEPKGVKCCEGIQNDCDCRGELQYDEELFKEYQESKDRVLFEGFDYDKMGFAYSVTKIECGFDEEYMESKTIEDLVKYNLKLTPTAKKQIGVI